MYRIIGADGKPYGPITTEQLRRWIQEGRANAQTMALAEGATEWKPLSDYPEFEFASQAPIGGPPTLAPLPSADSTAAARVNGPAIGLMILGGLSLLSSLAGTVMRLSGWGPGSLFGKQNPDFDKLMQQFSSGTTGLAISMIGVIIAAFILYGGIKMRKLESYGLCMTASVLAILPCFSFCCLIGIPLGIWAMVVLSKPEIKAAFH